MPVEPQNLVAVMPATTAGTPGASAAASCPAMSSALAMSISAGKVTTTGWAWAGVTGATAAAANHLLAEQGAAISRWEQERASLLRSVCWLIGGRRYPGAARSCVLPGC
jgi:hypothetical protein